MKPQRHVGATDASTRTAKRFGFAWLALATSLALHVADEALNGFLPVYNSAVLSIQEVIPWSPLPTFTFGAWITGLIALILLLFVVSPLVFRRVRWFAYLAFLFSALMIGNGLLHMGVSLVQRELMPGVLSSPLLLVTASASMVGAWKTIRETG